MRFFIVQISKNVVRRIKREIVVAIGQANVLQLGGTVAERAARSGFAGRRVGHSERCALPSIAICEKLNFEVIDSARFNPDFQPFAVIEQSPLAGELVKKDRKIYLTLNPANYNEVRIPDVIQITRRSAESTLRAVGLEIGEISYIDNIGKDMVLQLRYDNAPIAPGEKLSKTSRVDLVLGNGIRPEQ